MFTRKIISLVVCVIASSRWAMAAEEVVHLWPNGAPGFENRKDEPEQAQDYWVKNIHNPSITVFAPPPGKANGTAVVICPGGGHRELVYDAEGKQPAEYLNSLGVTAFVLKYRLAREPNSPYKLDVHPKQDAQRAMRLVRSRAKEWHVDPDRLGIVGFSAGGEVAALVAYDEGKGDPSAADPVDRESAKANFQIVIYPGPLGTPEKVSADAPPAFFLVALDDKSHVGPVLKQLDEYREAGAPIEVHILSRGGHGFNMGDRSQFAAVKGWPHLMADWLADSGLVKSSTIGSAQAAASQTASASSASSSSSAPATRPAIRIKAGSDEKFTDHAGNVWLPEKGFDGGESISRPDDMKIDGTDDPGLYRSEHYSMDSFTMDLPNGKYKVKLHFAETFDEITGPGGRVFSFNVNGKDFKNFDVAEKAGGVQKAYVETVGVNVEGGKLKITFTPDVQNPEINGIEIIPE